MGTVVARSRRPESTHITPDTHVTFKHCRLGRVIRVGILGRLLDVQPNPLRSVLTLRVRPFIPGNDRTLAVIEILNVREPRAKMHRHAVR